MSEEHSFLVLKKNTKDGSTYDLLLRDESGYCCGEMRADITVIKQSLSLTKAKLLIESGKAKWNSEEDKPAEICPHCGQVIRNKSEQKGPFDD